MGTEVGQNIRIIGVFGEKRIATFPDVPTVKEQGYDVTPGELRRIAGAGRDAGAGACASSRAACADAAKDDVYVTIAKRAGQPDDYYRRRRGIPAAPARATSQSKARVLRALKTQ